MLATKKTDRQTDRQTDDSIMTIADHTVWLHERLKRLSVKLHLCCDSFTVRWCCVSLLHCAVYRCFV